MKTYSHTQIGYLMIAIMGLGLLMLTYFMHAKGTSPLLLFVFIAVVAGLLLFFKLNVEVDETHVTARFGPGFISKKIALADIESFQTVRNPWYYGWGLKRIPKGWMYNVSGFSAVELKLADGQVFRIGTDEPEALERAISNAIGHRSH